MNEIIIIYIISILILLIISAFFASAETGVTSSSKGKIHRLGINGDKKAKRVEKLLKRKDGLMGTILLSNNIVNILASALATSLFIKLFGETGVLYATMIMTILIVVFSEIAPKTYALKNSEKVALFSSLPLLILTKIFSPITTVIQKIINFVINPKKLKEDELMSDLDEIRGTVELKHKEGSIIKDDKDMISSIIDLGKVDISEVVVHRKNIRSIDINQDLNSIIKQAFQISHTRIPLYRDDKDNIVAILNMRKLIKAFHKNKGDLNNISIDHITSKPWFVPETNNLKNQLFSFRKKGKRMAVIVDEYGALVGIVTLEDILEEIVGNMAEKEDDIEIRNIVKLDSEHYQIYGELAIRDINRELNWDLPEGDDNTSTLAGLVISKIERIPDQKEKFEIDGFFFEILKKEQNRIILLKVRRNESSVDTILNS